MEGNESAKRRLEIAEWIRGRLPVATTAITNTRGKQNLKIMIWSYESATRTLEHVIIFEEERRIIGYEIVDEKGVDTVSLAIEKLERLAA